ncbi:MULTISPECIES: PH domain-containing protein [Cryobacterium]|uniref:Low molecular weight protein antigen 6 PH domain-containing protein n=1 Tax=Cryobacterium breve TaxID=1259258 RepID=A0ABY2J328_9MICO|nr:MULTISPECIES: PH domain-containing protein [Cryobacterium]TFC91019.1 hypothetical protein E3T20_15480 [Cryobacterium sp. TmT3-12]TFC99338.1 hypothetical protein E3O65_06615 [Cryobacterium breve]
MRLEPAVIAVRSPASVVVFAAVALLCAALVTDATLRGRWDVALAALPAVALLLWAAWLVFARPCLRLRAEGLDVVNVLRTTSVPWGEVEDIALRHQVIVLTRSGERLLCWGAPSSARSTALTTRTASQGREPSGRISGSGAHRAIRGYWERHEAPRRVGEASVRRWHRRSILVAATLAVAVVVQLLVVAID